MSVSASARDERRRFSWRQCLTLLRAAGYRCQACGASVVDVEWHAHHIIPHAEGGETEIDNGQVLCVTCHKEVHRGV